MKTLLKFALGGLLATFGGSLLAFGSSTFDYVGHAAETFRDWVGGIVSTETEIDIAERQLEDVDRTIDEIGGQIATFDVQIGELETELESVLARIDEQRDELKLIDAEDRSRLSPARLDRLQRYAVALVTRHEVDVERASTLRQQIDEQRAALDELRDLRLSMETERHGCERQIETLRLAQSRQAARKELLAPFEARDNPLPAVRERLAAIQKDLAIEERRLAEIAPREKLDDILDRARPDVFASVAELVRKDDDAPAVADADRADAPVRDQPVGRMTVTGLVELR